MFNIDLDDCEEYYGELFRKNFIPYIAMRIIDHHELHALAVRLGLNEFEFASVLGKVSNNLLTKSQVILENWRNNHADIAEGNHSANNTPVVGYEEVVSLCVD